MRITTEPCLGHGDIAEFEVKPQDYVDWVRGKHVQDAFPYLTADDREWLVSRYCPKCWEEMLPPEEEEDEDEYVYMLGEGEDTRDSDKDWYV